MGWMWRNMLEAQTIVRRRAVARRLLRRAAGIVYNSTLYGFVIWCVGCVIPTPLDRAPAPTNYSPVWVTTRVTPQFGAATETVSGPIALTYVATDPNLDDTLYVKLLELSSTSPTGYVDAGFSTTLMNANDPSDPTLRIGSDTPFLCLHAQHLDTFEVYAVVADRPFSETNKNSPTVEGGLANSNHWTLTCM